MYIVVPCNGIKLPRPIIEPQCIHLIVKGKKNSTLVCTLREDLKFNSGGGSVLTGFLTGIVHLKFNSGGGWVLTGFLTGIVQGILTCNATKTVCATTK
jgi:hypothetical protein